mmetsp:Transcript_2323/g.6951  ORF Transcript_2323/g.6951 Transcript_2323/m.6951 type:complete len:109 (+) Transcript_2323:74-400(+)
MQSRGRDRRGSLLDEVEARQSLKQAQSLPANVRNIGLFSGIAGILLFIFGVSTVCGSLANSAHHSNVALDVLLGVGMLVISLWLLFPVVLAYRKEPGYKIPSEVQDLF